MNSNRIDLESINSLMPRAKRGDQLAQEQIFEQIYGIVLNMARKDFSPDLRQRQNPSDVAQQTMARMINGFENFRGENEEEFFGWLNAILRNEIRTMRRNQNLGKRDIKREAIRDGSSADRYLNGIDQYPTPGTSAIDREKVEMLHAALEKLPEDSATVIRLRSLEEQTFNEIAESMGRSYNAVAKLWQRAIVQLESELAQLENKNG